MPTSAIRSKRVAVSQSNTTKYAAELCCFSSSQRSIAALGVLDVLGLQGVDKRLLIHLVPVGNLGVLTSTMGEWSHLQRDLAEGFGHQLELLVQEGLAACDGKVVHMGRDDTFDGSVRILVVPQAIVQQ